ncbi:hypothetical protein [Methylobacterium sp. PvR107]|uniref:hypothetical protein n=1 Tax=Methylobacterium sp. PvR107 TaxID=2806597 RepID=UPI001B3EBEEB|nr:hypothetical protein [Methylobacterium sp. PvR107]MBP1181189.1 hypothetical protein [Methylobacterium sp. PvR107]
MQDQTMQDRTIGIGHNNPPAAAAAPWLAGQRARIHRYGPSVETAGRARADTLATEVVLPFPTRAQALAYAERQGLADSAEPEPARRARTKTLRVWRSNRRAGAPTSAGLPDLERALVNPAAVFDTPAAVRDHPRLLRPCKREILRRWAWDEYLKEVAAAEGMAEGEPSRLEDVKAALRALGETWHPHPAAPAAARPVSGAHDSGARDSWDCEPRAFTRAAA